MPVIGYGTYQIKNEDVGAACKMALEASYPHIDTAEAYSNETGIGEILAGLETRPYITTKVWPGMAAYNMPDKDYDACMEQITKANGALGSAPDLYLTHGPFGGRKEKRLEQWRALCDAKKAGLAVSIGVSNYGIAHLKEIEDAGMEAPAANQLEIHPYHQCRELLAYMRERAIACIAYSSLAPLSNWREGQQSAKADREPNAVLAGLAERSDCTEAQLLLRWALQKGYAILPKSVTRERIAENIDVFSIALSDETMSALDAMEKNETQAFGAPGQPFDPTAVP